VKINVKALAAGSAIFWGVVVLLAALANLLWSGYAHHFLEMLASIYPGYHATPTISQVVIGTLYAIVDGLTGGAILGWLYNRMTETFKA
jgi:hypothetical protein